MLILCCGDREWSNFDVVYRELAALPPGTKIVHGACRGADTIAGIVARDLGLPVQGIPADWDKWRRLGRPKAAGPIRNREMLDKKPDLVLAFHDDLSRSRGTKDAVEEARRRGIPVKVVGSHSKV